MESYHGWQPIGFDNDEIREAYMHRILTDSVPAIEDLLNREKESGGKIGQPLDGAALALIHKQMPVKLRVDANLSPTSLHHILALVRERILTWSLALEKEGVLGIGMSFSQQEKRNAEHASSVFHIGSINNMTGSIGGTVTNQHIETTIGANFRDRVNQFLTDLDSHLLDIHSEEASEIRSAANDVRSALADPRQDESGIARFLRKIPAAAIYLGNYATQALITTEVGKLLGGMGT